MKKTERHKLIKKMIKEEKLSTQKDIQDRLKAQGIVVTQTTLSRDLREIGLTKAKKNNEVYYVLADDHLQGVSRAEFSLVLHTRLGDASILANFVDANKGELILGTVTGANTLLVICRDTAAAKQMEEQLLEKMD